MKLLRASAAAFMMLAAVFVQTAFAAPFAKIVEFTQPTGQTVQLWGEGDDFRAVFETLDGYTVMFDKALKGYVYAELNADGSELLSTGVLVGQNRPAGLQQHLRINPEDAQRQAHARQELWEQQTGLRERWRALKRERHNYERALADGPSLMAPPRTVGAITGITLLIDFDDDPRVVTREEIERYCNAAGYNGYGNNGSVRDYYLDVSQGMLDYSNVITAYVRIPNTLHRKAYYVDPLRDAGESANELIKDALTILKAQPDFASEIAPLIDQATLNNRGQALALNVFYTGGNGNVWRYGLWPHKWALYEIGEQQITARTSVFTYQITNMGDGLSIATFCHENGHMICGYPDLYDYTDASIGGAGKFCLMSHGGFDKNPAQFCAYLKYASGWTTTVEVEPFTYVEASVASRMSHPDFNKIYRAGKPGVDTEYYLFEARSQADRDAQIPGAGLFIWHIDELGDRDDRRYAYNDQHQNYECSLVQADGLYHFQRNVNSGDKNDSWYAENNAANYSNRFKDTTTPSSKWWDGSNSRIHVGEISSQADVMTFSFIPPIPVILSAQGPLPFGREWDPYTYTIGLTGSFGPVTWSVINGGLPAGLTLGVADGVISGLPTQATNAFFDVEVMTSYNLSVTNSFSLQILPVHTIPYEENFDADSAMPDSWRQVAATNALTWKVRQNSNGSFPKAAHTPLNMVTLISLTYDDSVTKLVTPRLDFGEDARAGRLSFRHHMAGWNNSQDELRVYYKTEMEGEWELLETYLTSTATWTERIVDLPEISRSVYIAFEGTARYGHGICVDTIKVWDPTPPYGFVTSEALPNAVLSEYYDLSLVAEGGYEPYVFTVVSNSLPVGLSLAPSGQIQGVPGSLQRAQFDVQVQDARGQTLVKTFSLAVIKPSVNLFEEDFEHGGQIPYWWSQSTTPQTTPWVARGGGYNQHPPAAQEMAYNAMLFNGTGNPQDAATFQVQTNRLTTPMINLGQAPENITLYFWHHMEAWGNDQDILNVYYQSTIEGPWNLLASYTQNTPQWTQRAIMLPDPSSTYTIAFEGIARFGYGICIDNIRIADQSIAPIITTARELPDGLKGFDYTKQLDASGGVAPYLWELAGGVLPAGLTLSTEGLLSGVPTELYHSDFFVRVVGFDGHTTTNSFNLQVRPVRGKPYFEDFENNGAMPVGWTTENVFGNAEWTFANGTTVSALDRSPDSAFSGNWNAVIHNSQSQPAVNKLISPMIDLGGGVTNATVTFRHHMTKSYSNQDWLKVYYRNSLNGPWVQIQSLITNTFEWTVRTLALPNPTSTYFVAFEGWAQGGFGVCIDDVYFSGYSPSPYNDWLQGYFTEEEISEGLLTGLYDDADNDGIDNIWEFAFGLNPNSFDAFGTPTGGVFNQYLQLTYRQNMAAIDYSFVVEACTDLSLGDWSTDDINEVSRVDMGDYWNVTKQHDVPVTNYPTRFMRLKLIIHD